MYRRSIALADTCEKSFSRSLSGSQIHENVMVRHKNASLRPCVFAVKEWTKTFIPIAIGINTRKWQGARSLWAYIFKQQPGCHKKWPTFFSITQTSSGKSFNPCPAFCGKDNQGSKTCSNPYLGHHPRQNRQSPGTPQDNHRNTRGQPLLWILWAIYPPSMPKFR